MSCVEIKRQGLQARDTEFQYAERSWLLLPYSRHPDLTHGVLVPNDYLAIVWHLEVQIRQVVRNGAWKGNVLRKVCSVYISLIRTPDFAPPSVRDDFPIATN